MTSVRIRAQGLMPLVAGADDGSMMISTTPPKPSGQLNAELVRLLAEIWRDCYRPDARAQRDCFKNRLDAAVQAAQRSV